MKEGRVGRQIQVEPGRGVDGQLAARKLPGGAARLPNDPVASDTDRQSLSGRELVTVARYIGQSGDSERTRPFLLRLARLVNGPGETLLLSRLAVEHADLHSRQRVVKAHKYGYSTHGSVAPSW